ncbi:LAFA_0G16402g1_1 [Lachancea sp. 'fantastica']|nr:LAFA_0G16402g1_1 [Lachancea sp. 'fantastica']
MSDTITGSAPRNMDDNDSPRGVANEESAVKRKIVLCFDGTDGTYGPKPFSNVLKIYRLLDSSDEKKQLCYYQPGIGTAMTFDSNLDYNRKVTFTNARNFVDSLFAFTMTYHVCSAYMFLMKYYRKGDEIYMFGVSRGAFVARILAGMIERVGLLNEGLEDIISTAWKIYEKWEYAAQPIEPDYTTTLAEEFKKTFSRSYEIVINFQGLFDSVNSAGFLRDRHFPFTARSVVVRHVRHALSLDERRGKFQPQNFIQSPKDGYFSPLWRTLSYKFTNSSFGSFQIFSKATSSSSVLVGNSKQQSDNNSPQNSIRKSKVSTVSNGDDSRLDDSVATKLLPYQQDFSRSTISHDSLSSDIVEKWFPGDHADIGGGWIPDYDTKQYLSNISLRWMLSEAVKNGVLFEKNVIREFSTKYPALGSFTALSHDMLAFTSRGAAESVFDATKPPNRWLVSRILRQLFKLVKMKVSWLCGKGRWYAKKCNELLYRSCDFGSSNAPLNEQESQRDAFSPSKAGCGNQPLWQVFAWWVIELVPIRRNTLGKDCRWRNAYVPNRGRCRELREDSDLHWSVYWRLLYYRDYRPSNLPQYVLDLFEDLEKTTGLSQERRDSVRSAIAGGSRKRVTRLCPQRDERKYEKVISEARELLRQWSLLPPNKVPDDLSELLKTHCDL